MSVLTCYVCTNMHVVCVVCIYVCYVCIYAYMYQQYYTEVTIGFGRSSYTTDESDGGVTFVVHVTNGSLGRPVQVDFFTQDATATGNV